MMLMDEILALLKRKGVRLTPQRQEVLKALLERSESNSQPLSAEEILQMVRRHYPGVSFDTIYRTLATFKKLGLVNEVYFKGDDCRRFELVLRGNHHHHLVCLKCGNARELPFCPADCLAQTRERYPDFEIADHAFTVYGYCAKCRND